MIKKSILKFVVLITLFNCAVSQKTSAQKPLDKSEIKASMIEALEWQEAHPIFAVAPKDWTEGAYYTGVVRAHQATQDQIYMAALKNQGYWNKWQTFDRPYHTDDVAISYSYLYIDMNSRRKDFVDLKPTENFINTHLYEPDVWKEGKDKGSAFGSQIYKNHIFGLKINVQRSYVSKGDYHSSRIFQV
ncbi:MAG: unsaturated rhamnogalacturonyl hydrolase [Vicingaceae bacterium]|jgi:unsaturated rhamnogalacturonyl hydrolase